MGSILNIFSTNMKFELLNEMWSDVCRDYCMGIMFVGIIVNSDKKPIFGSQL